MLQAKLREKFFGPITRPAVPMGNLAKIELPRGCLACGLDGHSYKNCAKFSRMSDRDKVRAPADHIS